MNNKPRYRIIHRQIFDTLGKEVLSYFYIEKRRKFLCFSYWTTFWQYGEASNQRLKFSSIEEAEAFIRKEIPEDGTKTTIVKEI